MYHAMVLDRYDRNQDLLIFKNTYNNPNGGQPKRFTIKRTDPNAPEELFFVHIEVQDMANLPSQEQRKFTMSRRANKRDSNLTEVATANTNVRSGKSVGNRLIGRIIERDEFSGEVLESVGSRYFDTSNEILWVRLPQNSKL